MEIDARNVNSNPGEIYDLVIVGGGAAGIALAVEMANHKVRTALIESGGYQTDSATQELYRGQIRHNPQLPHESLEACRDRWYGGSSNTWGGYCLPLERHDFKTWPLDYDKDFKPFLARACQYLDLGEDNFFTDQIAQPLSVSDKTLASDALENIHIKRSPPTNLKLKYSDILKASPEVDVYLWANVTQLNTNSLGDNVESLEVLTLAGNSFRIQGKKTILAAGGIETPRLLLSSKDVISEGLGNAFGNVGRFYSSHPIFKAGLFVASPTAELRTGVEKNLEGIGVERALTLSSEIKTKYSLLNSMLWFEKADQEQIQKLNSGLEFPSDSQNGSLFQLMLSVELPESPRNQVSLASEVDPLGQPKALVEYFVEDEALEQVLESVEFYASEFSRLNMGRVAFPVDRADLEETYQLSRYHHLGATRLAQNAKDGVVDTDCKVFGTNNL